MIKKSEYQDISNLIGVQSLHKYMNKFYSLWKIKVMIGNKKKLR